MLCSRTKSLRMLQSGTGSENIFSSSCIGVQHAGPRSELIPLRCQDKTVSGLGKAAREAEL